MKGLIGYTGFVGSNLIVQAEFDAAFNTSNIGEIKGRHFDLLVCAAPSGVRWSANEDPQADWRSVQALQNSLLEVSTKQFLLISTIDVLTPVDEKDEDADVAKDQLDPYATHRAELEAFVEQHFSSLVVRLPTPFGRNMRKGPAFDLNEGRLDYLSSGDVLQWYYLERLWGDLQKAMEHGLERLNLATAPLSVDTVAAEVFDITGLTARRSEPRCYDMRSRYANIWGGSGGYLYMREQCLQDLHDWAQEQ